MVLIVDQVIALLLLRLQDHNLTFHQEHIRGLLLRVLLQFLLLLLVAAPAASATLPQTPAVEQVA
jgi:hypothetical protein